MSKRQTAFDLVSPRGSNHEVRQRLSPTAVYAEKPKHNIQPPLPCIRERFINEVLPMMYPGRQYTPESLAWRTQIPAGKLAIILRKMAGEGLCLTRTSSTFKTVYWVTDGMLSPPLEDNNAVPRLRKRSSRA